MCVCVCVEHDSCAFSRNPGITTEREREALMIYDNHFLSPKEEQHKIWCQKEKMREQQRERESERERIVLTSGCVTSPGQSSFQGHIDLLQLQRTRTRQKRFFYNHNTLSCSVWGRPVLQGDDVVQTFCSIVHYCTHFKAYLIFYFIVLFIYLPILYSLLKLKTVTRI